MKNYTFKISVFCIGLITNIFTLITLYDVLPQYTTSSWKHVPSAYTFYKYNTLRTINEDIQEKVQRVIPLKVLDEPYLMSTYDTVGYAFVLGSLWKITDSLNLLDIQIVQILMFCICLVLIFSLVQLLFNDVYVAFLTSMLLSFWYQLIVLNVTPMRDIWGFYGGVVLTYTLVKFFKKNDYSLLKVFGAGAFFGFCQFLRPNIFGQLLTLLFFFSLLFFIYKKKSLKKFYLAICIICTTNISFFWIPFMSYNKIVYNHYFVGPLGHGLLAALGTVQNPWGIECNDGKLYEYVCNKSQKTFMYASPDHNNASLKEFINLCKDNPFIFLKACIKSIVYSLWEEYLIIIKYINYSFFINKNKIFEERRKVIFTGITETTKSYSISVLYCFFFVKFLKIFGYFGILLAFFRRKYIQILVLIPGVFLGMWMLWLSHYEERYVIPFAWPLFVFLSYALVELGYYVSSVFHKKSVYVKNNE